MEANKNHVPVQLPPSEGIDFNKLRVIVWDNILWIIFIFFAINTAAYLVIRYTKDLYESASEIKLDVKNEANELGLTAIASDEPQNADLISGEIEMIRSKLFLNIVLDTMKIDVGYFSKGDVLNHELFDNAPFLIDPKAGKNHLNVPIYLEETGNNAFALTLEGSGREIKGHFGEPLQIDDLQVTIRKNPAFLKGEEEIDFFFTINSRDVLLNYLIQNLSVEPLNFYAKTIRVAFKDNNPQKAEAIVRTIDAVYLKYTHEQKNLANKQKIDWLNSELRQIESKMEGYENYFKQFTLENKTNNLDDDLKKTVETINSIDSQRFELARRVADVNQVIDGFQSHRLFVSPALRELLPEYVFRDIDHLQQLWREQEKLKLSYHEVTFAYREMQQEIDDYTRKSQEQLTLLKSSWLKKLQEITQQKNKLESAFINMPDKSTQFSKNERFYKLYEEFYLTLMQSKSEFEVAKAGTTTDFKILSPATLPQKPISPNRLMIAGIGVVSSFTVIIFFIGFLYIINNKITNLQELERISGVPVLGVVPASRQSNGSSLYVVDHMKSIVSEAIRTLRTNLEFFRTSKTHKVVAISSTVSGEGKSFVALNLGAAIAMSRKKVVLIDLDMRKTKTNLPFKVEDRTLGTSTILIRKNTWQECVVKTPVEFFDYIPSGPNPPNPSELLLREEFLELLDELKKNYDYIILDTPPVGLLTDGIQAMKQADVSIYIFRANYSKREFLLNLQRIININKFTNVTSILNAMSSAGEKAYGYGYGYYEDEGNKSVNKLKEFFKV